MSSASEAKVSSISGFSLTLNKPTGEACTSGRQASISSHATVGSETELNLRTELGLRALHFGAGNIGRGFIGKILSEAGIEVCFCDVVAPVINKLNSDHQYEVQVVSAEGTRTDIVRNVSALHSINDDVAGYISRCDMVTTAVGPKIIGRLAKTIEEAIRKRYDENNQEPLNIICCENMVRATSSLKNSVMERFDDKDPLKEWISDHIGFVDCAVDRIVPPVAAPSAGSDGNQPLTVTVEEFHEWIVDATQFVGKPPKIEGMIGTDKLDAFVERKLFTLNTGHAVCAYLGYQRGHQTIEDSIQDGKVCEIVKNAMTQSGKALCAKHGFDWRDHEAYIEKLIVRFKNPHLRDEVTRVAREPGRKLSAKDRLVAPLLNCITYKLPYDGIIWGIAGALRFDYTGDSEACKLQESIRNEGIRNTVVKYTEIKDGALLDEIVNAYEEFPRSMMK